MTSESRHIQLMETASIRAENPPGPKSSFGCSKEDLNDMFELHNIREGTSISKLQSLGGIKGLLNKINSDPRGGISGRPEEVAERGRHFGTNAPYEKKMTTYWELVKEVFEDFILRVLCVAAIVSIIVGIIKDGVKEGWIDGMAITVAIILIVLVTATNNWLKERQYASLYKKLDDQQVVVRRGGETTQISVFELLVGDVLHIGVGDIFPSDGIYTGQMPIKVDESMLTGESDLMEKSAEAPFLISGSKVMEGKGEMVVLAVGENSNIGKYYRQMSDEREQTPLQEKLEGVANDIGKIGLGAALATFLVLMIHLVVEASDSGEWLTAHNAKRLVESVIIAITIIVVAVPEGLPLAVTIALAYSMQRMQADNYLIKHSSSCEIMGGADTIATDKTGTLTMNKMEALKIIFGENTKAISFLDNRPKELYNLIMDAICYNSSSFLKIENGKIEHLGNKTECALLELAHRHNFKYEDYRAKEADYARVFEFSSAKKSMTTVVRLSSAKVRVFVKGSVDKILSKCTEMIDENMASHHLSQKDRDGVRQNLIKEEKQMFRVLAMAYRDLDYSPELLRLTEDDLLTELTYICSFALKDPIRPEIPSAMDKCRKAHINVIMVTGDALETAVAIAKEAGIVNRDYTYKKGDNVVMEGREFEEICGDLVPLEEEGEEVVEEKREGEEGEAEEEAPKEQRYGVQNLEAFHHISHTVKVLARTTPKNKLLLVTGMRQIGHIVAVTGDGTNDALALKRADVGIAMGIAGTQVARDAAGIILLDDNFNSIVTAVKWGRNIYNSIRMFIQFQLTVNIVALFLSFIGAVVLKEAPFSTVQMLWVNLIMDTFASLALATEPAKDELLIGPPYRREDAMITRDMKVNIGSQAFFQISVLSLLLFHSTSFLKMEPSHGATFKNWDEKKATHYTIFFHAFVFLQIFNEINSRKLKMNEYNIFEGLFKNHLFVGIIILTTIVQILMVHFGGRALRTSKLTAWQHIMCILIGASSLVFSLFAKIIVNIALKRMFRDDRIPRLRSRATMDRGRDAEGGAHNFKQMGSFERPMTMSHLPQVSHRVTFGGSPKIDTLQPRRNTEEQ